MYSGSGTTSDTTATTDNFVVYTVVENFRSSIDDFVAAIFIVHRMPRRSLLLIGCGGRRKQHEL